MAERVIVLHSGGLDSTTCLLQAQKDGYQALSLGIQYGSRSRIENQYAQVQCESRRIERHVVEVIWEKPRRIVPVNRTLSDIKGGVSSAFLPGRNALFLSVALAHAAGVAATRIYIGINCVDFSGYPDCTKEFLDAFSRMAAIASPNGPTIEAPLLKMGKQAIAKQAHALGLKRDETWSCYRPQEIAGAAKPCGICDACVLHNYAWSAIC